MISELTSYELLREKLLKKHSFTLEEVEEILRKPLNCVHTYLGMASLYYYLTEITPYSTLDTSFSTLFNTIPH